MRPARSLLLILIPCLAVSLPLAACGAAGGMSTAGYMYASLPSEPTLDGRVGVGGHVDLDGDPFVAYTGDRGGDIAPSYVSRQIYAFDVSRIPSGATIVSATLRLYQAHVEGNPYVNLGDVVVDHVDYVGRVGPDTYDGQSIARNIGTLSDSATEGYKALDVTARVANDLAAGRTWSQYRLRFYTPGFALYDDENDYANFVDGENDDWIADAPPLLEVSYLP